jgi:DNA-binding response OmpR family regulator
MTNRKHILIAEGDSPTRERVAECLAGPRLELTSVETGRAALEVALREKPDLLLTELVLPDMTGLGLCRLVREDSSLAQIGVVMLTGHDSEIDRVLAFEAGVDDFLGKPFYARELASRVIAVLRRTGAVRASDDPLDAALHEAVSIQLGNASAWVGERRLDLTPRELQLLSALIRQAGRVLTREQLVLRVWGEDSDPSGRVVDAHVKSIRRKLGEARECLQTVRGVGYRFSEQGARSRVGELRELG